MAVLIGTDEAGYGPNLGPLTIAASMWSVPDAIAERDLFTVLGPAVRNSLPRGSETHLTIADSKSLYQSGHGLADLETHLLAAAKLVHGTLQSSDDFLGKVAGLRSVNDPCCALPDERLPLESNEETIEAISTGFQTALDERSVQLSRLKVRAVFAEEFNAGLSHGVTKGELLSRWTLDLIASLVDAVESGPIVIQCDKHGGRNHYAALLHSRWPASLIQVVQESRMASVYRWGSPDRRIEIRFTAKGERFLPAALASMAAKYTREIAMRRFNHFWSVHVPGVRSTAGYPVDAKRFLRDINAKRESLGIPIDSLWRRK